MATSLKTALSPVDLISQTFTSNMGRASYGVINSVLSNDYLRAFLLTVASVYAGYTLQPVPKKLNKLFDTSTPLKFGVLFVMLLTAFYPLDNNKIVLSLIIPIFVLGFFEFLRKADKVDNDDLIDSAKAIMPKFSLPSISKIFNCVKQE